MVTMTDRPIAATTYPARMRARIDRLVRPPSGLAALALVLGVVNIVIVMIVFAILDRGRIISPAYGRMDAVRLARLRAIAARSPLASGASR